jgi:NADH-quinone oxidoreductase subunit M
VTQILSIPWLELAICLPLLGSPILGRMRNPHRVWQCGLAILGITLIATLLELAAHASGATRVERIWNPQLALFGEIIFRVDGLNLPLLPTVALLYLLTVLATSGTKLARFSTAWALLTLSLQLATLSCFDSWTLVLLLILALVPSLGELINRGKSARVFLLHMGVFAGLLAGGWYVVDRSTVANDPNQLAWGIVVVIFAILIRSGVVSMHCWLTDLFENASFGNAVLAIAPLTSGFALIRLVLPTAPDWLLEVTSVICLITALYAACMATIQKEARRFFAFVFLSHASLVMVGILLATSSSLTGSLHLWFSFMLSLGGFGLTLRALEARVGPLSLTRFHGLYEHSPALAICFMLTGLASVGFPGTAGFVAELIVDGALDTNPWMGVGMVVVAALNGIAVLRAYFLLFTGTRHAATIPLGITLRERVAVLTLLAILIVAGLFPQRFVASRYRAAESVLKERHTHVPPANGTPVPHP